MPIEGGIEVAYKQELADSDDPDGLLEEIRDRLNRVRSPHRSAEFFEIQEIIDRPSSPDTYSLPVTDKEFYFCIDYCLLDLLLYAYEKDLPVEIVSKTLDLEEERIQRVFRDFAAKERATWHLREMPPCLE